MTYFAKKMRSFNKFVVAAVAVAVGEGGNVLVVGVVAVDAITAMDVIVIVVVVAAAVG